VTVIGLCLGGGQIKLGLVTTAIGVFALWVLKWCEDRLRQEHQARFSIELDALGPEEVEIRRRIGAADLAIMDSSVLIDATHRHRRLTFEVRQLHPTVSALEMPDVISELAHEGGVVNLRWDTSHS
jgi:putative Mg2+ transporter-C (MgtC) family protein